MYWIGLFIYLFIHLFVYSFIQLVVICCCLLLICWLILIVYVFIHAWQNEAELEMGNQKEKIDFRLIDF